MHRPPRAVGIGFEETTGYVLRVIHQGGLSSIVDCYCRYSTRPRYGPYLGFLTLFARGCLSFGLRILLVIWPAAYSVHV